MKIKLNTVFAMLSLLGCVVVQGAEINDRKSLKMPVIESHWSGKTVAFLGDSITDKNHIGTKKNYWQYLEESLGIYGKIYGINGHQFSHVIAQAKKLNGELGQKVDAILIFAGTNDFNSNIPLGQWYEMKDAIRPMANGKTRQEKRRYASMNMNTLRGRINILMSYLKEKFPDQQIIFLTPIHRGFAYFSATNVQPDEGFANRAGLYIDQYVDAIKEVANVWAVPVIDLNADCGLYPLAKSNGKFFANEKRDMLHPNAAGHYKMAKTIAYRLLSYPSDFKIK